VLGSEVDDHLKDLVLLNVCLIAAGTASTGIIRRYANVLKEMLKKFEAPPENIDEATIRILLPSPFELLVFFLGSDVDEEACCSWCGRSGDDGLALCSQCRSAKYCGSSCQLLHWDRHKLECKGDVS
jgi:hypothetical protein